MRISREQTAQAFDVEPCQVQMVNLASKTWAREPVPAKLGTPRLLLFCVVLFFFTLSPVDALNTSRQISQYGHTAWRVEEGITVIPHQFSARSAGWKSVDWNQYRVSPLAEWKPDRLSGRAWKHYGDP